MGCKAEIEGRVVWLAEDYRIDGGQIEGPYSLHPVCADQPWPLYEISAEEAATWAERGSDSFHRFVDSGAKVPKLHGRETPPA